MQLFPNAFDQVFDRAHFPLHECHFHIQVFMVQFVRYVFFNEPTELLSIEDKTRVRIGFTLHGHVQFEIMSMPIFVSAFAVNFFVLFLAPRRVEQFMRRVKMLYACDVNHDQGKVRDARS